MFSLFVPVIIRIDMLQFTASTTLLPFSLFIIRLDFTLLISLSPFHKLVLRLFHISEPDLACVDFNQWLPPPKKTDPAVERRRVHLMLLERLLPTSAWKAFPTWNLTPNKASVE